MAHDVFISYSRKDTEVAQKVYDALDAEGVECFFDTEDIAIGEDFAQRIANAVFGCKAMVFIWSDSSNQSPNTANEIALAIEFDKTIVPFKITKLTTASTLAYHLLKLNRIDAIPVEESHIKELVRKVLQLLGKTEKSKETKFAPTKTYKVGDYYDDGKKQGVVFEVTADGKHGKIVSLTESTDLAWSADNNEQVRLVGADDEHNGANNMAKVKHIAGWREKYPAFAWCADLGEVWYLPAYEELKKFTLDDDVRDAVNRTLATKGKQIANIGDDPCYWSSTEWGEFLAWLALMRIGDTYSLSKYRDCYVRAVSAF